MLKQDNFLIYRGRVIKKVKDWNFLNRASWSSFAYTLNINKMEQVWWGNDFSTVIKKNSISSRGQLIAKPIFWTKVYKLYYKIITWLIQAFLNYFSMRNEISGCLLYFCKLLVIMSFLLHLNLVMNRVKCCSQFSWFSCRDFIFLCLKSSLHDGWSLHSNLVWLGHRNLIRSFLMGSENLTWILLSSLVPFFCFQLHLLWD